MSAKLAVCSATSLRFDDLPGMRTKQAFAKGVFELLHGGGNLAGKVREILRRVFNHRRADRIDADTVSQFNSRSPDKSFYGAVGS